MYKPENYKNNRHWSDNFLPQVINIIGCGRANVNITPFYQDVKEAADLVIKADDNYDKNLYAAVRLRKSSYVNRYPYEFTVRYQYNKGYKTEFEKIMEGYADIMFYGFVINNVVSRWIILDMDCFRKEANENYIIKEHKLNVDKRNSFLAFDIRSFKSDIMISHSKNYY